MEKRLAEIEFLKKKHKVRGKRLKVVDFPDYKIVSRYELSNKIPTNISQTSLPIDAKIFPVGHNHKQGLELITPETDLQWMGGKKS